MFEYIIKIDQPYYGTTYYCRGPGGVYNKDKMGASRFGNCLEAVKHILEVLKLYWWLREPVMFAVEPAPKRPPETLEMILAKNGDKV